MQRKAPLEKHGDTSPQCMIILGTKQANHHILEK